MISDARGGHVSPGVYTEEKDVVYAVKSLGITSLGLAGETVKGPAFQSIPIEDWADFVDYFGGVSAEKYKGSGQIKYELPYIAKSYLSESRRLSVVRVLGLSGYYAGKAWVLKANDTPIIVLRSKMEKKAGDASGCEQGGDSDGWKEIVSSISNVPYTETNYDANCAEISSAATTEDNRNIGLKITATDGKEFTYNISLDKTNLNYIYNVFSSDPLKGMAPVYIEAVYDYAYEKIANDNNDTGYTGEKTKLTIGEVRSSAVTNYFSAYREAKTPWIVSDVKGLTSDGKGDVKKLFRFYTISDGNAANYQVKVSIQDIRPDDGTFDVVIRDYYDNDANPMILEKFTNCNLVEGDVNYLGLKIGTVDGIYANKSKYVMVEMAENDEIANSVPAGFLGYPVPDYGCENRPMMEYNTRYESAIKARKQYFGLNNSILDEDILSFKGVNAYDETDDDPKKLNNGFHLDSALSLSENSGITVDGVSGFTFDAVTAEQVVSKYTKIPRILTEKYMKDTIYEDPRTRKFTVYTYGGFDGWDIHRDNRTNSDKYSATNYPIVEGAPASSSNLFVRVENPTALNLPTNAITTDYYAYLAGYRQFANPQETDINLFATPGIDWLNNRALVEDAIDMIEDKEDGRGGDALYIVNTPMKDATNEYDALTIDEIVQNMDDFGPNSSYACTYYPWVKYYDSSNAKYIDIPVTKDVVRIMAKTDNELFSWWAPAGMNRGGVDCVYATKKTTLADEDELYENRINPVKTFGVDGVKIWGNKTLYDAESPINRINVRRLMIRLKKLITSASHQLIFDQLDAQVERQFRSIVEPILANAQSNRGISDYKVITEFTPETRDQHILPAKILVKPIGALEYISISFVVYPESVDFEEN